MDSGSYEFLKQFGMTIPEAIERASKGELTYKIEFQTSYVERLVCSMHYYDDQHQKNLMKESVMMESIKKRKDQMKRHGFNLDIEDVKFKENETTDMTFVELKVSLIKQP
jgi:hypothetical protein